MLGHPGPDEALCWAGAYNRCYIFALAEYSIRGIEGLRSTRLGELRALRALPRKPYIYVRMYISNTPRSRGGLARIRIRIRNSSATRIRVLGTVCCAYFDHKWPLLFYLVLLIFFWF